MKLILIAAAAMSVQMGLAANAAPPASQWDQPAAALAGQIAEILGPGQARLTIRNLSSISADEIPAIRLLMEQDLKARGVTAFDAESANAIRVTLSENARERLWIAEVVEGSETKVAMVDLPFDSPKPSQAASGMTLRRQAILTSRDPVLAALETPGVLVVLEPEQIVVYARVPDGWKEQDRVRVDQRRPLARDPRGILLPASGEGFEAWLPGVHCTGNPTVTQSAGASQVQCSQSDDPWTIMQTASVQPSAVPTAPANTPEDASANSLKAFFNAARNYFTGVVTPSLGVDLPPFYSAALIPRPAGGAALLVNGIDGKVQMIDNGTLKTVSGTRDWGSDLAALQSGCGAGTQIIASSSGEAASDSLRAYELPALEAVPASPPLTVEGTTTALWTAPDNKSVFAVVRNAANEYEVDRVTASCN